MPRRLMDAASWASLLYCLSLPVHAAENPFLLDWGDPRVVAHGEILLSDAERPPPPSAAWQPVTLPDMWDESRPETTATRAWYRFPVSAPERADLPYGVYLWRYSMTARIYFNDELLADGGRFEDPAARNIHRPMLALVPASAWRKRDNRVYVNLRVYPGYGYLLPVAIGAHELLLPAYRERYFYQVSLSQYLFVVILLVTVMGLFLWALDQRQATYGYFTAACLCWLIYCLNPFIQTVPFSMKFWLWLLHSCVDLFSVMFMLFIHRMFDYRAPRLERAALGYGAFSVLYYIYVPIGDIGRHSTLLHLVSTLIILYLVGFTLATFLRSRRTDALLFLAALMVLVGLAVHDLIMISGVHDDMWQQHFLANNLSTPIMFLIMVGYLMWRLHANNVLLREQVGQATRELETSYHDRQALERQQAASDERERIYRDLHDDVGARLLSMVYRAESPAQAALAREALNDIRSLVAQTESGHDTLGAAAADWHAECARRCQDAHCDVHWDVEGADTAVNPHVLYHCTRILRELLTNAIRHGGPTTIRVSIVSDGHDLTLTIEDDGTGFDTSEASQGSGISGIEKRLSALGGQATWQGGTDGTRVWVHIPRMGGWPKLSN